MTIPACQCQDSPFGLKYFHSTSLRFWQISGHFWRVAAHVTVEGAECGLEPGGIFWGLTPHGQSLGSYESWRNAITLHKALVEPASNAWGRGKLLGKKFAADVLLHEMIHQALFQQGKVCPESHNCEAWCDEINRLIP